MSRWPLYCSRRPASFASACRALTPRHDSAYSSISTSNGEQVRIPCGSNGSISLRIHQPRNVSNLSPPIVLYLPPGPLPSARIPDDRVIETLASRLVATIVQIDYRFGKIHCYPTPVHDVLFGYDWVLKHLVSHRAIARPGRSDSHVARIGVFGELLGGSLASMLALTECRQGVPHIAAAAVNEPIVDWVFPESAEQQDDDDLLEDALLHTNSRGRGKRGRKGIPSFITHGDGTDITASGLLQSRKLLFRKQADMLDPFASPTLFFRSPGIETPLDSFSEHLDEFEQLALLEREDFHRQQLKLSAMSNVGTDSGNETTNTGDLREDQAKSRKWNRRYPRIGSGLQLPNFRVSHGQDSPLLDQGAELVTLMRRSLLRSGPSTLDQDEHLTAVSEAEQRMQLSVNQDTALWSTGQTCDLEAIGEWFQDIL